MLYVDFAHIF